MVEALGIDEDTALIRISDDGVGFDPAYLFEHEADGRSHYGIANVSRRLELLYGKNTVRVASTPGSGTNGGAQDRRCHSPGVKPVRFLNTRVK
jgi:sensor histidine kinase YesM